MPPNDKVHPRRLRGKPLREKTTCKCVSPSPAGREAASGASDVRRLVNKGSLGFRRKRPHLVVSVGQAAGSLANPGTSSEENSDPENT